MMRMLAAAAALSMLSLVSPGQPARSTDRPYLAAATETARWIRSHAQRLPEGTVWPPAPAASDPRMRAVNTTLYTGTPGVVLFFLELHKATGRAEDLADARAGADYLLATMSEKSGSGLYTGVAGVGFVLGEVHKATGDAKYRDGMRRAVDLLRSSAKDNGRGVEWTPVTDIIGGTAGTGLFLLHAARELQLPEAKALAVRAGDRLIELGRPEGGGLKWPMSPQMERLMPNFSHGTAGIAYFLARLYEETRERRFLDAAVSGAKYLQSVAATEGDMCLIFHHEPEEDGKNLFYLGYCHGPVGTARLWYQLAKVTDDKTWMDWVHKSARGILSSGVPEKRTPGFWNNVGQCCGSAGVAEFFLHLHQLTGSKEYLAFSERVTAQLLKAATKDASGMYWVHAEHRVRPDEVYAQTGWMQGAAGIGAWLLRLDGFSQGRTSSVKLPDLPF